MNNKEANQSGTKASNSVSRLGLPQSNINFKHLPSIRQVFIKMQKHETTPIAFRIDETTYAALDLIAKQHDTSASAFVNQLLNTYVEQKTLKPGLVANNALNIALERFAKKLSKQTDAQINLDFYGKRELYELYEFYTGSITPKSKTERIKIAQHFGELVMQKQDNPGGFNISIQPTHNKKASSMNAAEWKFEDKEPIGYCDYLLSVPLEKWPTVLSLLSYYEEKLLLFYGDRAYESAFNQKEIGNALEDIVEIINSTPRNKLAPAIALYLKKGIGIWDDETPVELLGGEK